MVVIVGDNGTFAPGVKEPFNANYAKGWVYQTGVWVPLIVAGPQVVSPDRDVPDMVNVTDLFQLFGEIVGVDVHQVVPSSHILDSASMMPYITNPNQASIRTTNFTQGGNNIHSSPPTPCVVQLSDPPTCVQLFNVKQLCEFEGGIWYPQYTSCCEVKASGLYPKGLSILPDFQSATRNDVYKLVEITAPSCSSPAATPRPTSCTRSTKPRPTPRAGHRQPVQQRQFVQRFVPGCRVSCQSERGGPAKLQFAACHPSGDLVFRAAVPRRRQRGQIGESDGP